MAPTPNAQLHLANEFLAQGQITKAEAAFRMALAQATAQDSGQGSKIAQATGQDSEASKQSSKPSIDLVLILTGLGRSLHAQDNLSEAQNYFRLSLEYMRQLFGQHPHVSMPLQNLARVLAESGQVAEAIVLGEEAVGLLATQNVDENKLAQAFLGLSHSYYVAKDYTQAEKAILQAKEIWEKLYGKPSFDVSTCLNNLGRLYEQQGKSAQGAELHAQAVAIRQDLLGDHPETAFSLGNYGAALAESKQWFKAKQALIAALACYERLGQADAPAITTCRLNLETCLKALRDDNLANKKVIS